MSLPLTDQCVLLTGAGGSIGAALAKEISKRQPRKLILLDHSEGNLHQLSFELSRGSVPCAYSAVLADISDEALLTEIFEAQKPAIVLHAAAYKHVPLMESNAIAAVRNNALGTYRLAMIAAAHGVEGFVMVSTDKAVHPQSVMGATKRVAELALLRWSSAESPMRSVRLGNVLGSQGSVAPTFLQQIAAGGPVTLTHPEATRYFFSMKDTVELILATTSLAGESGIFIPYPEEPVRILDLANQLIRDTAPGNDIPIVITGLRPGDKMSEQFVAEHETVTPIHGATLRRVDGVEPSHKEFDTLIEALNASVQQRDVAGVLEGLRRLVPEYRPGKTALAACTKQQAASR